MNFFKKLFSKKEVVINSYSDFWDWFKQNESTFYKVIKNQGNIEKVFFRALSPKLDALKDGIFYLTGMCDDTTVELILTPDGNVKNVVFVEELVQAAPKIKGWKFTALKPSMEGSNIVMDGFEFNSDNLFFYAIDDAAYPDEINIVVVHEDYSAENSDIITNGTYIFLDNYLGELNFISIIDEITIKEKASAEINLVPIGKLIDFMTWRQKEFLEKYQGFRRNTSEDNYSILNAELKSGNKLVAVLNTDLLKWESKASHPWVMIIKIDYEEGNNGMPDKPTQVLLDTIEEELMEELKDFEGYLNIGRQTSENCREIYFACKDFRKPSKILYLFQQRSYEKLKLDFEIYKDKYWRTFNRFGIQ